MPCRDGYTPDVGPAGDHGVTRRHCRVLLNNGDGLPVSPTGGRFSPTGGRYVDNYEDTVDGPPIGPPLSPIRRGYVDNIDGLPVSPTGGGYVDIVADCMYVILCQGRPRSNQASYTQDEAGTQTNQTDAECSHRIALYEVNISDDAKLARWGRPLRHYKERWSRGTLCSTALSIGKD